MIKTCACGCGETFVCSERTPNRIYKRGHGRRLDRPNLVETTCYHCGKIFNLEPARLRFAHNYCSHKCSGESRRQLSTRPCYMCGKAITRKASKMQGERVFCSSKCFSQFIPIYKSNGITTKCAGCNTIITVHPSKHKRNKKVYCSWACRNQAIFGTNNPSYRSGLGRHTYYGANWKSQRRKVLERDGHTCQYCHESPKNHRNLHVHHITPAYLFHGDYITANNLNNLTTLCYKCHKRAEKGLIAIQRPLL